MDTDLSLYFDGSCSGGNPGGIATYGWRIEDAAGKQIHSGFGEVCRGPTATNNVGEWSGLTAGLQFIIEELKWIGNINIYGDSQLVINQLTGYWKCKKPHLQVYLDKCQQLLESHAWQAAWIPREKNQEADQISRGNL